MTAPKYTGRVIRPFIDSITEHTYHKGDTYTGERGPFLEKAGYIDGVEKVEPPKRTRKTQS